MTLAEIMGEPATFDADELVTCEGCEARVPLGQAVCGVDTVYLCGRCYAGSVAGVLDAAMTVAEQMERRELPQIVALMSAVKRSGLVRHG